jgi:diguanylate cyclase (GGDEF)-like protein/hemerythrin-like metal-binding protein
MRTLSFATLFFATALHIADKAYSPASWSLLAGLLLIYPHLQHWRVLKSEHPIDAAVASLRIDSLLLGIFVATVQFSDWLTFSAVLGAIANATANNGWRGIGRTLAGFSAGILVGIGVYGYHFAPHTEWPTSLLCMIGLGSYVLTMTNIAFARNVQLRRMKRELEFREAELLHANQALQGHLHEIDALQEQLRAQADRDALTGLYNRRYLDSALQREMARCRRDGRHLSLVMIDIDHFKKYNDRYGHLAGDQCLKCVADALQASAKRAGDLAARYGGEEFSLVLPDTDGPSARWLAESLRQQIESRAIAHEQSTTGHITISLGIAVMTDDCCLDVESLLRAADNALYYAKWAGRNRVQVAPDTAVRARLDGKVAETFAELVWQEKYDCGEPGIDKQHRLLFQHANTVLAAMSAGRPSEEVTPLIDTLMRNVVQHFADEETAFLAAGFPEAQAHAAIHRQLMAEAVELFNRFHDRQIGMGALFQFLAHDVIALHMLGADRQFQAYLRRRGEATDGAADPMCESMVDPN